MSQRFRTLSDPIIRVFQIFQDTPDVTPVSEQERPAETPICEPASDEPELSSWCTSILKALGLLESRVVELAAKLNIWHVASETEIVFDSETSDPDQKISNQSRNAPGQENQDPAAVLYLSDSPASGKGFLFPVSVRKPGGGQDVGVFRCMLDSGCGPAGKLRVEDFRSIGFEEKDLSPAMLIGATGSVPAMEAKVEISFCGCNFQKTMKAVGTPKNTVRLVGRWVLNEFSVLFHTSPDVKEENGRCERIQMTRCFIANTAGGAIIGLLVRLVFSLTVKFMIFIDGRVSKRKIE